MKQDENLISKRKKILILISVLIIIAGISILFTKGLNFSIKYKAGQKVAIKIGEEFQTSDIEDITKQVFENQEVLIQKVEIYKDTVSIKTTTISEEQKDNLVNKINERYGKEIKSSDIEIKNIANLRGRDLIKPYIIPLIITTAIVFIYMVIRFHKLSFTKVVMETAFLLIISQLVLLSIIAIFRIPVDNYIIIAGFIVYIFSLLFKTNLLEKELEKRKIEEDTQSSEFSKQ